jgi:hypothetical protein
MSELLTALTLALTTHAPALDYGLYSTAATQIKFESAWNPSAELKTVREHGCGLMQITRVYGRFDKLDEMRRKYPALAGWTWADCKNVAYQLPAFALLTQENALAMPALNTQRDTRAFQVCAYNAGPRGCMLDRRACEMTHGCDPSAYFGGIALACGRSPAIIPGIGRTACDITRGYVAKVMDDKQRAAYATLDVIPTEKKEVRHDGISNTVAVTTWSARAADSGSWFEGLLGWIVSHTKGL